MTDFSHPIHDQWRFDRIDLLRQAVRDLDNQIGILWSVLSRFRSDFAPLIADAEPLEIDAHIRVLAERLLSLDRSCPAAERLATYIADRLRAIDDVLEATRRQIDPLCQKVLTELAVVLPKTQRELRWNDE